MYSFDLAFVSIDTKFEQIETNLILDLTLKPLQSPMACYLINPDRQANQRGKLGRRHRDKLRGIAVRYKLLRNYTLVRLLGD
jgi:hypothetical protein